MNQAIASKKIGFTNYYTATAQLIVLILVLYFTSLHSYLLFHTLVELSGVIISGIIFLVVWNARRYIDNGFFVFLGIALLFSGGLLLFHMLAYEGMNVFRNTDSNTSLQLWIAGRYMTAISFLLAPFFIKNRFDIPLTIFFYSLGFLLIISSIFLFKNFPSVYFIEEGITEFKKQSEYVISGLFALSALLIYLNRHYFNHRIYKILILSSLFAVASEIIFSFYTDIHGFTNMAGHLLLLISFYLIYLGIIETSLRKPSRNLYFNMAKSRMLLKKSEVKLRRMNEILEEKVRLRTYELQRNNEELNARTLLLKLSSQTESRKKYLNELVKLIKEWSGCTFVGIRIINADGNIPYNVYSGFSQKFWESENWLSAKNDHCICGRVMQGNPDTLDLRMISDRGSFYCNNTNAFFNEMSDKDKGMFRGVCAKQGFMSLGIIPIKYGQKIIGLIHLADKNSNVLSEEKIAFIESLSPLIGSTINKYNTQESLDKSTRALAVLSEGNHILIHSKNEKTLLKNVCRMIVERGNYVIAWIGYSNINVNKKITPVTQAGITKENLIEMIREISKFRQGRGSAKIAIFTGKTQVRRNILNDPNYTYLRNQALKYNFKSSISIPLKVKKKIFGAITIYARESIAFDKKEIELLEELASDMAFGIDSIRAREAKDLSEKQLIESYEHLGVINRKISVLLDLEKNVKSKSDASGYILETAMNISFADIGFLYKFKNDSFSLLSSRGAGKKIAEELKLFRKESHRFLDPLIRNRVKLELRSDIYNLGCFNMNNKVRCYLIIPLVKESKLTGAIFLGYYNDKKLFDQELEFYDLFEKHASAALSYSKNK